jgi:hypothetical protein
MLPASSSLAKVGVINVLAKREELGTMANFETPIDFVHAQIWTGPC